MHKTTTFIYNPITKVLHEVQTLEQNKLSEQEVKDLLVDYPNLETALEKQDGTHGKKQ